MKIIGLIAEYNPIHLGHIYQLAKEKNVTVIEYPLSNYRACGIIKSLADT